MIATYPDENGNIAFQEDQPPKTWSCSKRDLVVKGKNVLERFIAEKNAYNEWVAKVVYVDQNVTDIAYVPTEFTGTYAENLLAAITAWLENH